MDDRISLGAVWEETAAFVRAEAALLMPLAFAGFGLPVILMQFVMPDRAVAATGQVTPGPWMWGFLPYAIVNMGTSVAISALALKPRLSVGEAIAIGARALPAGIALAVLAFLALVGLSVVATVAAHVGGTAETAGPLLVVALLLCFVAAIATLVRVMPVWAVLAAGPASPIAALRRAVALTKRHYLLLLMLRVVAWLAQALTILVVLMPVAVVLSLAGMATGAREVAEGLTLVAGGAVVAGVLAVWTVYVARLARRLQASSSGI